MHNSRARFELWPDEHNAGRDDNMVVTLDADSDGDPDFLIGALGAEADRLHINGLCVFGASPGQQSNLAEECDAGCCSVPWQGIVGLAATTPAQHVATDPNASAKVITKANVRNLALLEALLDAVGGLDRVVAGLRQSLAGRAAENAERQGAP